jgi:hypothetical protein
VLTSVKLFGKTGIVDQMFVGVLVAVGFWIEQGKRESRETCPEHATDVIFHNC